ncbi:hypothetical protein E4U59_001319 [Claviceps monticola]|nr:hypothetical protein E4U59_001319 [Claviceps monticola]
MDGQLPVVRSRRRRPRESSAGILIAMISRFLGLWLGDGSRHDSRSASRVRDIVGFVDRTGVGMAALIL